MPFCPKAWTLPFASSGCAAICGRRKANTCWPSSCSKRVGGQSRNDFTARLHIALKEIYETSYWLEPLYRTEYLSQAEFDNIAADCGESTGIVVRILKPTKQGAS